MIGPSIILSGVALGSGEYVLWPSITAKYGFVVFWACLLGVITQYFLNMEIERWALATGESAITGFCRLWRGWAPVFLACNIIPWVWPGWASAAGEILSWEIGGSHLAYAVGSLFLVGIVLTIGPVVYTTVERLEMLLCALIVLFMLVTTVAMARLEGLEAMARGAVNIGYIPGDMDLPLLLAAIAFAGAGGTMNLAQANYIKDKGYAMGSYVGRITSPITGKEEAISSTGFFFEFTEENLDRWRKWWRAASIEHFFSFFLVCAFSLGLLSLFAYSTLYGREDLGIDPTTSIAFVRVEAEILAARFGGLLGHLFLLMGIAIMLTTELGLVDAAARVSTDIVRVNFLRESTRWTDSRLYFTFLWGHLIIGAIILLSGFTRPLTLLVLSASLNAVVMFLYAALLLYLNWRVLKRPIGMGPWRILTAAWAVFFFGYFSLMTALKMAPRLFG